MGYYDGNTVTALWNYAQHFALNDNNYTTQFGPSTPGAINLISGQTNGFAATTNVLNGSGTLLHATHEAFGDAAHLASNLTEIGDGDPLDDVCSNPPSIRSPWPARTSAICSTHKGITWGCVHGRLRSDGHQCQRHHRLRAARPTRRRRAPRPSPRPTTSRTTPGSSITPRPPTRPTRGRARWRRSAQQDPGHQHAGAGQPSVRHQRLLRGAEGRQPAGGELPQGAGLPGRPCRLFRSDRRAALPRQVINALQKSP